MMTIKLGQVAAVNEFGATDFFDILFNDELGYAPNAHLQHAATLQPGGQARRHRLGRSLGHHARPLREGGRLHGLRSIRIIPTATASTTGTTSTTASAAAFEVGYKEQNTLYAGVYKLGATERPKGVYTNPATGEHYHGDYNIYFTAEKTVYHPIRDAPDPKDMKPGGEVLDTKRGLDLLFEFVGEPGDRNPLQYEAPSAGVTPASSIAGRTTRSASA